MGWFVQELLITLSNGASELESIQGCVKRQRGEQPKDLKSRISFH